MKAIAPLSSAPLTDAEREQLAEAWATLVLAALAADRHAAYSTFDSRDTIGATTNSHGGATPR